MEMAMWSNSWPLWSARECLRVDAVQAFQSLKQVMKRVLFFSLLAFIAAGIWFFRGRPEESPKEVPWPSGEIHEVRAYAFDHSGGDSVVIDGHLNPALIDPAGVKLDAAQTQRLLRALVAKPESKENWTTMCYDPHHGFVFFDKQGGIVAHVTLCLHCENGYALPDGPNDDRWDIGALKGLLVELQLPVSEDRDEYSRLYRGAQTSAGAR